MKSRSNIEAGIGRENISRTRSALIGVIGTYPAAILKHRKDLEFKYDTDLREKRITQYLELWKLLHYSPDFINLKEEQP